MTEERLEEIESRDKQPYVLELITEVRRMHFRVQKAAQAYDTFLQASEDGDEIRALADMQFWLMAHPLVIDDCKKSNNETKP